MAAHVVVTLDTTAPTITWGDLSRVDNEVRVGYTLDEGSVTAATLTDSQGATHNAVVTATYLSFAGPANGQATVTADLADAVGNTTTATTTVYIGDELGSSSATHTPGSTLEAQLRDAGLLDDDVDGPALASSAVAARRLVESIEAAGTLLRRARYRR